MTFPAYPAYKNSGVQWIGSIPEHWCASRLRNIFFIQKRIAGKLGFDVLSITNKGVKIKDVESGDGQLSSDYSKYQLVMKGEFAMNHMDLVTGYVDISEFDGVTSPDYRVFSSVHPELDNPRFMLRLLQNAYHQKLFFPFGQGSAHLGRWRLPAEEFKDFFFPRPSRFEQTQIARFLDHETARIDALIEEQQRLIELLKEKRQAVISHAVTKGLDPTVTLKDSGVEWLGEVPAHWVVAGLKWYWSVTDCKHITAEFVDEGIPLASIREVQSRYVALDNAKQTTEVFYRQLIEGGRELVAGDLIFSRNATVGEVAQVANWHPPFAMGQDVCVLKKQYEWLSSDYLQAVLRSPVVMVQLDNLMIGSTFKRVNVEDIRGIIVPMPPQGEQKIIAEYLIEKTEMFNSMLGEAQNSIALLQERRSALISAAVTGKIDVRGWQPPASARTPELVEEAV